MLARTARLVRLGLRSASVWLRALAQATSGLGDIAVQSRACEVLNGAEPKVRCLLQTLAGFSATDASPGPQGPAHVELLEQDQKNAGLKMERWGRPVSPLRVCHPTLANASPGARPARAGVEWIAIICLFCPYCSEVNVMLNAVKPCSHESEKRSALAN